MRQRALVTCLCVYSDAINQLDDAARRRQARPVTDDREPDEKYDVIRRLIGAWTERVESAPLDVVESSALAEDDEATAYLQLSHMVHRSLHVAVDHLQALADLGREAPPLLRLPDTRAWGARERRNRRVSLGAGGACRARQAQAHPGGCALPG